MQEITYTFSTLKQVNRELIDWQGKTPESCRMKGEIPAYIPILTFLSGHSPGKEIPVVYKQIILGRGNECDIVVSDPAVSRKHLQISCRKTTRKCRRPELKVILKDLGSKTGTLVNYSQLSRTVLKPGDKIILGRIVMKYEHRDLAEQKFYDEINKLVTVDSVTNVLNRAAIAGFLTEEYCRSVRDKRRVSIIMIDIDSFKSLNNIYGRLKGNNILQVVAETIGASVRRRDRIGRFGEDEFLVVLPETGEKQAVRLAERIRRRVESTIQNQLELKDPVSVSLGVSSIPAVNSDPDQLLENAETALFRSKSLGRNRVERWIPSEESVTAKI